MSTYLLLIYWSRGQFYSILSGELKSKLTIKKLITVSVRLHFEYSTHFRKTMIIKRPTVPVMAHSGVFLCIFALNLFSSIKR